MKVWSRLAFLGLGAAVVGLIIWMVVSGSNRDVDWQAVGAGATLLGSLAAAVSAYYSSRSSSDAAQAAAEAREAMILLGRAGLDVTGARREGSDLVLGVSERMGEIAVDVDLELELAGGERLQRRERRWPANFMSEVHFRSELPADRLVPRKGTLTYGDTRGMARFELSFDFDDHGNAINIVERRLWPAPLRS